MGKEKKLLYACQIYFYLSAICLSSWVYFLFLSFFLSLSLSLPGGGLVLLLKEETTQQQPADDSSKAVRYLIRHLRLPVFFWVCAFGQHNMGILHKSVTVRKLTRKFLPPVQGV